MKIYNTLARKKETFFPLEEGHVRLYVCGITSYDYCHIGHARSALVFDMVVRYLRHRGYKVTFVRNFTDIDDKIIARAAEQGVDSGELAERFIDEFYTDMDALGILRADIEPKATEHIQEMIDLVADLIGKGLAYPAGGDVYYRVRKFAEYGTLSGRKLEDMQAGARIDINEQKEDPMDFVLWKGAKPGEPKWQSPWGEGRPGWHIECSAMSRKYLGQTFDIHGGGKDLIFPHHENELAQSVGANQCAFANLWMHHGFVTIKDEKMSKSLGNFLTIRDVLREYPAETLRLFIFSTQYRNPLDFSETALQDAQTGLDRMYDCLAKISEVVQAAGADGGTPSADNPVIGQKDRKKIESLRQRFETAMDNDFNTAQALGHLFDGVKVLNKACRMLDSQPGTAEDLELLQQAGVTLQELTGLLGVVQQDPVQYMQAKKDKLLASITLAEDEINTLIAERNAARERKDWAASDAVRDKLLAHNVELYDGPDGTTWGVKA
ncbi:MAG: cysteine--tRNA ligase [Candidatus Electrothrix aestuarii]|uniref:Cysteine--tRNA ligase n=1 Tax=Candidatus Electrothrix aestuarii TaxID=3062594 RepID=A0AAU8LPL9_9BACT|nr:cysteine--tRNA ligase [Candidatus Electrothrix aestuarii]